MKKKVFDSFDFWRPWHQRLKKNVIMIISNFILVYEFHHPNEIFRWISSVEISSLLRLNFIQRWNSSHRIKFEDEIWASNFIEFHQISCISSNFIASRSVLTEMIDLKWIIKIQAVICWLQWIKFEMKFRIKFEMK